MFVEDNASFVLVCTLMIDVSFSKEQLLIIKNTQEKKHIFFKDIKNLLKVLTLNQLEFV